VTPEFGLVWFILRSCHTQHDNGYIDSWSQIQVHTDERTHVHNARSSLVVTHPSTNRGRRALTSGNVPFSALAAASWNASLMHNSLTNCSQTTSLLNISTAFFWSIQRAHIYIGNYKWLSSCTGYSSWNRCYIHRLSKSFSICISSQTSCQIKVLQY